MVQPAIAALLGQTIGLNPDSIGSETIARAVRRRMAHCGLSDMYQYLERLQTSGQEVQELIEQVVVPETWFFRDQMPFAFLGRYVRSEWLPCHQHTVLQVLSLACSTGEEPYSIAMALLDADVAPQHFRIDAVDINQPALGKAKDAVYGSHSFRGDDLVFRERYFEPWEVGYRVRDVARNTVTFMHGNILDGGFLADQEPYAVIFCRNMLMYFDQPARNRAIKVFERLLTNPGLLFVGHAETSLIGSPHFVSAGYPRAFAYRKVDGHHNRDNLPQPPNIAKSTTQPGQDEKTASPRRRHMSPRPVAQVPPSGVSSRPPDAPASPLETARRLADQGRLDEAATLCETYMRENDPSAQAYTLMGLIRQIAGQAEQAEQCFNRAIYLQSDHHEALIHLALLVEHRGDTAAAAVLRQRAQRAQN
ncbi:MAG: CheR family methyltransferase [Candidatus Tectomicrobia bacterium]